MAISNKELYYQRNNKKKNDEENQSSSNSVSNRDLYIQSNSVMPREKSAAQNAYDMYTKWQNQMEELYKDYTSRSNTYGYKSDHQDWYKSSQNKANELDTSKNNLLNYMDQYKDYIDSDWANSVKDVLSGNMDVANQIVKSAAGESRYFGKWKDSDAYNKDVRQSSYYEKYKDMSAVEQETARNKLNTTIRRAGNNGDTEAEKAAREELDFLETYGSTGSQIAGAQNKYYELTNSINEISAEIEIIQNKYRPKSAEDIVYIEPSQKNRLSELKTQKKELEEQRAYYSQLMSGKDTYSAEYEDKYSSSDDESQASAIAELQKEKEFYNNKGYTEEADRIQKEIDYLYNHGTVNSQYLGRKDKYEQNEKEIELLNKKLADLDSEVQSRQSGGYTEEESAELKQLKDRRDTLIAENNQYKRSEQGKADEYYEVTKADDFEEMSSVGAAIENPTIEEISAYETALDPVHQQDGADYWNNVLSNAPKVTNKLEFYFSNRDHAIGHHLDSYVSQVEGYQDAMKGASRNWDYFEDNERKTYNYILATEGEEAADAYLDSMQVILDRRANEASQKNISESVNKPGIEGVINRVGLSIASVPLNVFGGAFALLDDAASAIRGEYNPYSPGHAMMLTGQNARNAVAQKFAEDSPLEIMGQNVAGQIYNALMSSADSVLGAATMGRMYTIVMGSSAASTHARELYEKGATGSQIFFGSLTAGVAEALFEYVSIDKLLTERNIDSIMQAVKAILVQSGVEATEEIFTDVSNLITDNIVMGVNSDYEQAAAEYEQKGYSRSDALRMALIDAVKETAWSGISGALSGGFSGTVFTGAQAYGNYKTGEAIRAAGNENAVLSAAQSEYAGEEANTIAEKINKKGAATNMQLGALKTAIQQGAIKSYDDLVSEFADAGDIKADLVESGMDEKTASKKANTISKIIKGENVSARAEAEIRNDPIAKELLSDYEQTINVVTALSGIDSVYNTASEATQDRKSKYSKKKTVWDEPERLDVSEGENEGKTILKDTGEEIGNYEIVDTDDGALALKLDNGTTVDTSDVSFASNKEASMIEMFSDAGASAETVNAFMNAYDENAGVAHGVWTKAITDVYDYGVIGASKQYMQNGAQYIDSLTEEQINLAYERGRADRAARVEARKKLIKGLRAGVKVNRKTGTRLSDDAITNKEFQKINEKGGTQKDRKLASMKLVHNLAKALGVRVTFYASELATDGNRYYIDENGNRKLAPNGKYSANGEIFIDINSGKAGEGTIIYTLAHELTHFIKDWSPEKFKVLSEMLLEKYAEKGYSVTDLVDIQIENAKKEGRKISRDVALEEVVADSCETFLTDKNVLQTLQEIKQKDTSLFGKIKDFFSKAIKALEKVIGLYDGVETNSQDGRIVAKWKEELADFKRIYAEGLADASDNYSYSKQKNNTSEGVRYESRYFVEDKYYQRKIDEWESLNRGEYIKVGTINKGSALNNIGLPIGNLYFDVSKIKDEMEKHEDHLSTDIMKKIPQLLDNPIAITEYKPGQDTNTVSVYSNLYYKGTPITVGIVAVKNRAGILITKVRTIHARGNLKNQITDKSILFLNENKKETDKWFQAQGHRVPMGGTKYGFIRSIQLKYDSVNTFDKNSSPSDENSSERHSSRAQLDEEYLQAVESGDMKTAQKMVDEAAKAAGYTVKYMYHGSHSKFNVFDIKKARYNGFYGKGFYFSDSKVNAGVYGETYRVYLKTLNPLEPGKSSVTKTQLKKYLQAVSENEDYDIYNYGTTNINDIADNIYKNDAFAVIQDVNATAIGDFSEAIKLYNEVNGTSYDSIITPTETVVYNNTQIKLSDPVTYYDNGNVIPLSERFNENNEDIRFSSRSSNIYNEVGELERLRKENAELQDDVEGLKQLIKLQKTVTKGTMKTQTAVEHAAKELMEKYGVKNNKDNLASLMNQLSAFYTATATTENVGDLSWDDVQNQLEPVARWIVDNGTVSTAYPGLELSESEKAALNDYFETELLRDAVQSIYDTYWRASTLYTTADKHGMEIDALKAEHKKAMSKLRADKNARIEAIKAKDKEYYHNMISRLREKKNARIDETKKHASEMRLKGIENRKQTQLRHKIEKVAKELSARLLNPAENKYVPKQYAQMTKNALTDLMPALDTGKSSTKTEKLNSLVAAYSALKVNTDGYNGIYDDTVANNLSVATELLNGRRLMDLNSEELTIVYHGFAGLKHVITTANKLFSESRKETIGDLASAADTEIRNIHNRTSVTEIVSRVESAGWSMLTPQRAMNVIGSDTLTGLYTNMQDTAEREYAEVTSLALAKVNNLKSEYGYKEWELDEKNTYKYSDGTGENKVSLTLGQLMSVYAYSRRPIAAQHLARGGFVEDSNLKAKMKKGKKGNIRVTMTDFVSNPVKLDEQALTTLCNNLTDRQKKFVDEMQDFLSSDLAEKGNEASMKLLGYELFGEEHYFPIRSSKDYILSDNSNENGKIRLKNMSMTKATVPNASNPIVISDFMDVWSKHVNDMALYCAAPAIEDFSRVYYFSVAGNSNTDYRSLRGVIKTAYGSSATNYIENLIESVNNGLRGDNDSVWWMRAYSKFKKAAVFGSLSVIIQQPTAFVRAFAYIPPKYFIAADFAQLKQGGHKAVWNECKKYCSTAVLKEYSGYDLTGRSMTEIYKKGKTDLEEIIGKAPALADEITWASIWIASKRMAAEFAQEGSQEYYEKAAAIFNEAVRNTQVYDSVYTRSQIMRSNNALAKMATQFMAEPTTSLNMYVDAAINIRRGGYVETAGGSVSARAFAAKTIASTVTATIFASVMKSIIAALRDDDEDETYWEKYVNHLTSELKDNLNPLNLMPFIKDIVSLWDGYDVNRSDTQIYSEMIKSVKKLADELKKDENGDRNITYKGVMGVVTSLSSIFGFPLKNMEKDLRGIINTFRFALNGDKTTAQGLEEAFTSGLTGKEKTKAERIYEAYLKSDTGAVLRYQKEFKDADAMHAAIRSQLRKKDERIKEAAQKLFDRDVTGAKEIEREIIDEGRFSQDDILAAVTGEYNVLKTKQAEAEAEKEKQEEIENGTYKEWWEEEPDGETEEGSLYSAADLNIALEGYDLNAVKEALKELRDNKMAEGKTEKEADGEIKQAVTSYWKPKYQKAVADKDTVAISKVYSVMEATKLYGSNVKDYASKYWTDTDK